MNSFVSTTAIEAEPQTATEEVVRLTEVKRRFGTTAALDGISLTVKRGEILGIIGRSGAGKSTLIRCLNGLERADSGEILIEGRDITGLSEQDLQPLRRRIGMTKAVAEGLPKRLIEEAAARRQAAVDKGEEVIVGVNRYRLDNEQPIDILEIDNSAVRKAQIRRIEETKRRRDGGAVREALAALAEIAQSGKGNLLEAAIAAARTRATVGEISDAMRAAFGDHAATPVVIKGVYGEAYENEPELAVLKTRMSATV